MPKVQRLAPCEAMVALFGAVLVVGGILGCAWLVPFHTEIFVSNVSFGATILLMLASLLVTLFGVIIYLGASSLQFKRLEREEKG